MQIYTLTVLNGNETWIQQPNLLNPIKNEPNATDLGTSAALDFDSILNTFSGYIKTEFAYDGNGFCSDSKDNVILTQHGAIVQQHQQPQSAAITSTNTTDSSLTPTFQNSNNIILNHNNNNNNTIIINNNNNNDWQMSNNNISTTDNNVSFIRLSCFTSFVCVFLMLKCLFLVQLQESAESLLRSALQGKGYTKGIQLQNCIAIIPGTNIKNELINGDNQVSGPPQFKQYSQTFTEQFFSFYFCLVREQLHLPNLH